MEVVAPVVIIATARAIRPYVWPEVTRRQLVRTTSQASVAGPRLGVGRHARRVPTSAACMALARCLQRYAESIDFVTRKTHACCGRSVYRGPMHTLFRSVCKVWSRGGNFSSRENSPFRLNSVARFHVQSTAALRPPRNKTTSSNLKSLKAKQYVPLSRRPSSIYQRLRKSKAGRGQRDQLGQ